jgi:hypothetical protein
MVVQQERYRYLSNIGWPEQFPVANTLTWIAVCALLAGAVVEMARWRGWLAGGPFTPLAVATHDTEVTDAGATDPGPTEQTEGPTDDVSAQVDEAPTEASAEASEDLGPDTVAVPSPRTEQPESSPTALVADPPVTEPSADDEGESRHHGPLRATFGRLGRWLRRRRPGTLASPAEAPDGGEPPSDHA